MEKLPDFRAEKTKRGILSRLWLSWFFRSRNRVCDNWDYQFPIDAMVRNASDFSSPWGNVNGSQTSVVAGTKHQASIGHPQTCVYPDVCLGIAHVSVKAPLPGQGALTDTQCICPFRPTDSLGRKGQIHCASARPLVLGEGL